MLKLSAALVVLCELIAFVTWLVRYRSNTALRHKLFTVYLGILAISEALNFLLSTQAKDILNLWILHVNIPLQIIFLIYFLLYDSGKKINLLPLLLSGIYIFFYTMERLHVFVLPVNFDSMSYGVGNLLLIAAVIIALVNIFRQSNIVEYNHNTQFWIIIGIVVFYIGSFPYQNFRNQFWANPAYYNTAYAMHYLTQAFNCIMYLLFAYSVKWRIN